MSRFLGVAIFLIVASGMVLHAGVELPWFADWVGNLPGDLLIKKGGITIYLPVSSSVILSAGLSMILSAFSSKSS